MRDFLKSKLVHNAGREDSGNATTTKYEIHAMVRRCVALKTWMHYGTSAMILKEIYVLLH